MRDKLDKLESVITSQQVQLRNTEELLAHSKVMQHDLVY